MKLSTIVSTNTIHRFIQSYSMVCRTQNGFLHILQVSKSNVSQSLAAIEEI